MTEVCFKVAGHNGATPHPSYNKILLYGYELNYEHEITTRTNTEKTL